MSDLYKNPETEPQARELVKRGEDHEDWGGTRMNPVGPAGTSTHINQNEKGILEDGLHEAMAKHQVAELGSIHDSYAVGIYGDTSSQYSD
jgi:hypothetical protein